MGVERLIKRGNYESKDCHKRSAKSLVFMRGNYSLLQLKGSQIVSS